MGQVNQPPIIKAFNSYPAVFVDGYGSGTATLSVKASDPEDDPLIYTFEINGQTTTTRRPYGNIYAPQKPGKYILKVTVDDGAHKTSKEIEIIVVDAKDVKDRSIGNGVIGLSFHKIYTDDEIRRLPLDQRPDDLKNRYSEGNTLSNEIYSNANVYYYSFEGFKRIVTWLESNGYQIIPLRTLADAIYAQNDIKIPDKAVFISFDDGWKSQYQAIEWLAKRGHPSTLFAIGKPPVKEEGQHLNTKQVLELASLMDKNGDPMVEIASHSTTHNWPNLGFDPREAHGEQGIEEYNARVSYELHRPDISTIGFAAPYGEGFNKEQVADTVIFPLLKEALISSGYIYNRTTQWEYINYPLLADPYILSTIMPICVDEDSKLIPYIASRHMSPWASLQPAGATVVQDVPAKPTPQTTSVRPAQPIDINKLSIEEKCSMLILAGIGWWTPSSIINSYRQQQQVRNYHLYGSAEKGGVPQVDLDRLQRLQGAKDSPIIITIDQESGPIDRLGWAGNNFRYLSLSQLAAKNDIVSTREVGRITGEMLNLFGVNLNLAPFMDLHSYESTKESRRISQDPHAIAKFALAFSQGLMQAGVGVCPKHFPDGSEDNPHDNVIRINRTRDELCIAERYKPLIDAGVPAIMMSHVIFNAVDPINPASLSKVWIQDVLRGELGFQGLVVTDVLDMKGITSLGVLPEDAAIRAFNAGVDIILLSDQYIKKTRDILIRGVQEGRIPKTRLDESVRRILDFHERFPIQRVATNTETRVKDLIEQAASLYQTMRQ